MTPSEALAALPFGAAFHFVDSVNSVACNTRIVTSKSYDGQLEVIAAHMVLGGLVPGSVMIEQAAQTALVLALIRGDAEPGRLGVVGAIKARFERPVTAPAELFCHLNVAYLQRPQLGFAAEISLDGAIVARVSGACTLDIPGPTG